MEGLFRIAFYFGAALSLSSLLLTFLDFKYRFLLFVIGSFITYVFRSGIQHEKARKLKGVNDINIEDYNYILYLRSFVDDKSMSKINLNEPASIEIDSQEEQLVEVLSEIGEVVALGKPGEEFPLPGAKRLYFGDNEWREQVTKLIKKAKLIIVRVDKTKNLWWEIEQCFEISPAKTVLLTPNIIEHIFYIKMQMNNKLNLDLSKILFVKNEKVFYHLTYFDENLNPYNSQIRLVDFGKRSLSKPYLPIFKKGLEPIFKLTETNWTAPGLGSVAKYLIFVILFAILFFGVRLIFILNS